MLGNHFRSLDDKNRVVVPAKLRNELGGVFYITLGFDNVLELRDKKSFNVWSEKLQSMNMLDSDSRAFTRMLLGNTHELEIDKQGRIVLPEHFLQKTGITKEVVFVGVGNKVELWAQKAFDKFQDSFNGETSLDELAKKLVEKGAEL